MLEGPTLKKISQLDKATMLTRF